MNRKWFLCIGIWLDGKFLSIETNEPFKYDVFNDADENQKRYETIGRLVDEAVFEKLESECHLQRQNVPVSVLANKKKNFLDIFAKIDAKKGEQTSFIFISDDVFTADYLMVIIHGTGVVRAGQWSRK